VFSGIVETLGPVLSAQTEQGLVRIHVACPPVFDDLKIGDSIANNGVCLTVESFDKKEIIFALGAETLQVTGWTAASLSGANLNLERSLRFGDRIHGHMVAGHVDAIGRVCYLEDLGGSLRFDVEAPESVLKYIWKKGSWAVNGVSLTINEIQGRVISMCLIPETLKRTNLGSLKVGASVNLEVDTMARSLVNYLEANGIVAAKGARQ